MVMTFRGNPLDQYVDDDDIDDEEWVTPDDLPRVLTGLREAIYNPIVLPELEADYNLEVEEDDWVASDLHESDLDLEDEDYMPDDEEYEAEEEVADMPDDEDYEAEEEVADLLAADDAATYDDEYLPDYLPDDEDDEEDVILPPPTNEQEHHPPN